MNDPQFGKCPICGDVGALEGHHIIPISYGGPEDGQLVYICEKCHFACHRTAESLLAKNPKKTNWFSDDQQVRNAAVFVKAIIEAKRNYLEGHTDQYEKKRKLIVVKFSAYEWTRIRKFAKDKGFTNVNTFIEQYLRNLTKF